MSKIFNIIGLVIGFLGALLAFLDSYRTSSRFVKSGVKLGYEENLNTWFWKSCGNVGFALITLSFAIQLVATCIQE